MGKSSQKQEINEYTMSIHLGLCYGPVDAITGLLVGEKLAWSGEVMASVPTPIYVNSPSLFGGPKDEGGVGGVMYYLPGGPDQVMPDELASRFGLTSNTCPAFRGIASVFFTGFDGVPLGSVNTTGTQPDPGGLPPPPPPGSPPPPPPPGDGGGGYVVGGSCVWTEAYLPDGRQAVSVEPGDTLLALDYDTMAGTQDVVVRASRVVENTHCVTLVSISGIRKTVSRTTPFTTQDGRMISVMDCAGEMCATQDENGFRWELIVDVLHAGRRPVVQIDAGGATFAGGDEEGRYLFTHNILKSSDEIQN